MAVSLRLLFPLCLAVSLVVPGVVCASPAAMKAPGGHSAPATAETQTSGQASQPLLGAIRFFKDYISPTDGARCQFDPSCSTFGYQAIRKHGAWLGLLMTTDRLMRCSYWTDPADYPRHPDGRLVDPVAARPGSN